MTQKRSQKSRFLGRKSHIEQTSISPLLSTGPQALANYENWAAPKMLRIESIAPGNPVLAGIESSADFRKRLTQMGNFPRHGLHTSVKFAALHPIA
jgi:hypothetical protein